MTVKQMTVEKLRQVLAGRNGKELVKIDGFPIDHVSIELAEGGFHGYVDLTPACSVAVRP